MSAPGVIIEEFTAVARNTLRGFARVRLPSGMVLHDVQIHTKADGAWAMPASKPMLDRNGGVVRDTDGKIKYAPVVSFATKELRDRFSAAIIDEVRRSRPEALR